MKKKVLGVIVVLGAMLWALPAVCVFAQEAGTGSYSTEAADWKQEISSDREQLKGVKDEIKGNAQTAREEEKNLREQIRQAEQSGDPATAESLKEQLRTTHQENVQQMQEDRQGLKDARQELKTDVKGAHFDRMDKNNDGVVDDAERKAFQDNRKKFDQDNNPPGPKGGPGTNWENKPGLQGGAGASPDYRGPRDRDNNPPGPKGGRGTNWENRPGPQGGPGASPNRGGGPRGKR